MSYITKHDGVLVTAAHCDVGAFCGCQPVTVRVGAAYCSCHAMSGLRLHVSPCRFSSPLLRALCRVTSVKTFGGVYRQICYDGEGLAVFSYQSVVCVAVKYLRRSFYEIRIQGVAIFVFMACRMNEEFAAGLALPFFGEENSNRDMFHDCF